MRKVKDGLMEEMAFYKYENLLVDLLINVLTFFDSFQILHKCIWSSYLTLIYRDVTEVQEGQKNKEMK